MDHLHPDSLANRLAESLQQVEELASLQEVFVSNEAADMCPPLQRVMLELIAAERMRRDGCEISGYSLPEFSEWPVQNMLAAGTAILILTEVATLSGQPDLMDFGFRLAQFWFLGSAKVFSEVMP